MTPMMELINALNAVVEALQKLEVEAAKKEVNSFEPVYIPPELKEKSQQKEAQAVPVETEVKLDEVREVLAEKLRTGHKAEIKALIKKYGADKLSELPKKNYADVLQEAEQIGK